MIGAGTAPVQEERPRVILFYDERSGRSRRAEGFLAQVLQRRGNHETFRLHRIEVGQRPDLADKFQINTTPTLLVVADRKVQARLEGLRGCNDIEISLRPWLK